LVSCFRARAFTTRLARLLLPWINLIIDASRRRKP
jgi:hypothetical protein